MQIPLGQMTRRANPGMRRDTIIMPDIDTTAAQEGDLFRLYMAVVRVWHEGARTDILPAYSATLAQDAMMRDSVTDVQIAIDRIDAKAVLAIFQFGQAFRTWATELSLWHLRKFVSSIKYATNVDLGTVLGVGDTRLTIEQVLARNVGLVRDVSDQARGRISDIVFRGLQARTPVREVAKQIQDATGLARKRSMGIASDQTVKLSASLDRERQLQVGMDDFEWMSSHKVHFRPEHAARDHKIFAWSSPVGTQDPPGWLPYCGCKAKGVLRIPDGD